MAGTISFGGIGSGLDVDGIVSALVTASKGTLNSLSGRATSTRAAASTISELSSLMASFTSAVRELDEAREAKCNQVTSSASSVVASATGAAQAGSYGVKVLALATQARVYSSPSSSATTGLGATGSLELTIAGESVYVEVAPEDSLTTIAARINEAGLRVSATTFYDGSEYRLLLNGLDKGTDNALTVVESGLDLGLNLSTNIKQRASNARAEIDGFVVTSQSNQIAGAIPGVTLGLSDVTDSPVTVTVEPEPEALQKKLTTVVDRYNAVVRKVQSAAGFGTTKAGNSVLAGDSTLRSLSGRMSSAVMTRIATGTQYDSLASLGVSLGRDGTLSLDASKLKAALADNEESVSQVLAGPASADGIMDVLRDMANSMTQAGAGLLSTKAETLGSQAKVLEERATREQDRLDRYADQLRSQFSAIESSVSASYSDLDYLSALYTKK